METLDLVFQDAFQVVVTVIVCNPFVSKLCFIFPSGKPTPASVVLITVPSENFQVHVGDAVRNAKAAVEEGIVAGGGVALLQASKKAFEKLKLTGDEATGAKIVEFAIEAPLKQIAINAGLEGGVVVEKVRNLKAGEGLNAATGEYVDMIKSGIIDPAKVTRSALQNAASIAALFLTTEAVIADKPEPKPAMPAAPGGDMDF